MLRRRREPEPPAKQVRCAIYTRKRTQEGLEQDFNSLDAQRESAEAYVASQKAEGWVCLPDHYDDGGFARTLDRYYRHVATGLRNHRKHEAMKHWSLTTLREKLIKIRAKVVTHSRYVIFQMAEVTVPRELFAVVLEQIQCFGVPPPLVPCA